MHPGTAHLFERHLLADDHLGHPWATEIHGSVALDHDDEVTEAGDVGTARGARTEERTDLRHPARQGDLVVEDPAGAAPAGEHLDLVGDAGPGGVDEPEDGQLFTQRHLGGSNDLLHGAGPPRACLDGRVVRDHDGRSPLDRASAGDDPVGGQTGSERVGVAAVLDEGPLVEEQRDAVTHVDLALPVELGLGFLGCAGRRPVGRGQPLAHVGDPGITALVVSRVILAHAGSPSPRAMTIRWISEVPSPISRIFASR